MLARSLREAAAILGRTTGSTLVGATAMSTAVEASVGQGLPCCVIVGLPDSAIRESRMRIESALRTVGLDGSLRGDRRALRCVAAAHRQHV